jgi:hypothetical protein
VADEGATIDVEVFTKNTEDTGDGSVVSPSTGSLASLTGVGQTSATWGPSTLKELVRYRYTVKSTSEWLVFRMLPPVWFDSVAV